MAWILKITHFYYAFNIYRMIRNLLENIVFVIIPWDLNKMKDSEVAMFMQYQKVYIDLLIGKNCSLLSH